MADRKVERRVVKISETTQYECVINKKLQYNEKCDIKKEWWKEKGKCAIVKER